MINLTTKPSLKANSVLTANGGVVKNATGNNVLRILILEDNDADYNFMLYQLKNSKYSYLSEWAEDGPSFEKALTCFKPDIILADYNLPTYHGMDAFYTAQSMAPEVPVIIVSGAMGEERAVELIKSGVTDYVLKDKLFSLVPKICRAIEEANERKAKLKAETELKHANMRRNRAQALAHIGWWEIDLATGMANWTPEMCVIYGLDPENNNYSYHQWLTLVHPDDRAAIKKQADLGWIEFADHSFYHRIVRPDGNVRYVYSEARFEFDTAGKPVTLTGIVQDLTERRETENKLHESEATLKDVFDNTADLVCAIGKDHRLVSFNQAFANSVSQLIGVVPVPGMVYIDHLEGPMKQALSENFERAMAGEHFSFEAEFTFGGKSYWFGTRYSPIIRDSQITGVAIFSNDITKQKTTELLMHQSFAELQSASEQQTAILNTLPANIALLDKSGVIIKVNDSWRAFVNDNGLLHSNAGLGEEYVGIARQASGAGEDAVAQITAGISDILNGNIEKFSVEYASGFHDAKNWYRTEVRPLEMNNEMGAVVMYLDITDRTMAELEVKALNRNLEQRIASRTADLEKANKELESFSYTVSHDLQAPLKIINGFSTILQRRHTDVLNADAVDLLTGIKENTLRMSQIIDDLLKFSRMGRTEIKRRMIDMNGLLNVVLTEQKQLNAGSGAQITVHDLKPANADCGLIHQVWANLLSNAIKYSGKNPCAEVEIGMTNIDGEDTYYVKDNGAGFDMQYYDRLFTVFQRLHTTAEFEGTGVGLALVNSVIAKHGGRVWAEGKVNGGAAFYFTLP